MILAALLIITVVFFYLLPNKNKRHNYVYSNLIENYGSTPKTIKTKIHIIISLRPNINNVIKNILKQTERVDMMSIIVPEQYETKIKNGQDDLCKLVKDTCIVQISGGYAMLAKERENGTILIYAKGENSFLDPNSLKQMITKVINGINDVYNFNDAVCVKNSLKIGVNDAYNINSTF
jgi:hypothetical protein